MIDDTDIQILECLVEDARHSYTDIAEVVDLSPPAVSDRIDRLRESGVIRRFTVELDRSQLRDGVHVLVTLSASTSAVDSVYSAVCDASSVEHTFMTADNTVIFSTRVRGDRIRAAIDDIVNFSRVDSYDVSIIDTAKWSPTIGGTEFALSCDECGNTVTDEGRSEQIGDNQRHFCCSSCLHRFRERYNRIEDDVDAPEKTTIGSDDDS
ncbi:winged helix-turn-helix transcriptional regulator [Haloquadratum walsbyi]|jgi:transcriptional regulator, AsnC family|uniref:Transcriptional regulator n=1 Tax=Haloquadratum walsbyi J07HQW2 TaxID=1238425 RepID=U1NGX8_9EURY|nr:winged helix-turn-helix transcriptional regulator [Haloquadratum walsbyi]ERG96118.1 MAG: transcriptional regulator [Haloquadratum walsbyi J07HQW2]